MSRCLILRLSLKFHAVVIIELIALKFICLGVKLPKVASYSDLSLLMEKVYILMHKIT